MKTLEMTVRRARAIVDVFDNLPEGAKDWTDAEPRDLRNALGDKSFDPRQSVWPELWKRYKSRQLHQEILHLADNLNMEDLTEEMRKEIEDGLNRLSSR